MAEVKINITRGEKSESIFRHPDMQPFISEFFFKIRKNWATDYEAALNDMGIGWLANGFEEDSPYMAEHIPRHLGIMEFDYRAQLEPEVSARQWFTLLSLVD